MTEAEYDAYVAELQREFPGLRVVSKEGDALSRLVDLLLKIATLGAQREYLTRYTTVIARTIYVPLEWPKRSPAERYVTMRHEAVHLRQAKRYGIVAMSFLYAIPFFPVGLAYGRARIEWEAYAETFRAAAEVWGPRRARAMREHVLLQFTSGAYLWMWPFRAQVNAWIDEVLSTLPPD
jgi:hypothetical protein